MYAQRGANRAYCITMLFLQFEFDRFFVNWHPGCQKSFYTEIMIEFNEILLK